MTILFVCSGNIHRSALAAGLLSHLARRDGRSDLVVLSAGVIAVAGLPCVEEARSLARADGVDLSDHRSRPLDEV
ncbi:MAG TPA: hypothetical protein VFP98_09155, partial [Candidatus Polarisedimenticolia bacterium]|nr:hypothetical protein [Candidatus Polarisedimenticolia bacterium]